MDFLKILKKYIIDSQLYVSLAGTLLATFFMLQQNTFRFPTAVLIFITYFCGYLYTKYQHSRYFRRTLLANIIAGGICTVLIIHNHNITRLYKWAFIVILGLLYNSFFLETYIRKIPLLKVFYVGLVWGLVNAWLSVPEFNIPVFAVTFLFVTALVLPFDIRDMHKDDIVTFPKIIGEQKTKYLAYLMVFAAVIIAIFTLESSYSTAFFLATAITFVLIFFSESTNQHIYFSFWVESCSMLPFLFLVLLK